MGRTQNWGDPGDYRKFALDELTTDDRFNRDVSQRWVDALGTSGFSFPAFNVMVVWENPDGVFVLIDGQHRVQLARDCGLPKDAKIFPGILHRGLELNEVAELFVALNRSKLVGAWAKYKALRTAGHTDILDIDRILGLYGLTAGAAPGNGTIGAIAAVMEVYRDGQPNGAVLSRTLMVLNEVWGPAKNAYRAHIMKGLGLYIGEHRDVDPHVIALALSRKVKQPEYLESLAAGEQGGTPSKVSLDLAIAITIEKQIMGPKKRRPKAVTG